MKKQTFNLDMDGVVADFIAGAEKVVGYRIDDPKQLYPDSDWEKLRANPHHFLDLPLMHKANEIVNVARQFRDQLGYDLVFLTAIPHYNDMRWAFWDKMMWAQRYFPDIAVHFGPYSTDKKVHCIPGDILVDDRADNCNEWTLVGGIAIEAKYNQQDDTLRLMTELLVNELSFRKLENL